MTAEEQGLLGSQYYSVTPLYPLAKTAANINMDGLNVNGRTKDLTLIGSARRISTTTPATRPASRAASSVPTPEPEKGFYYRSDHFNFAKQGVPALDPDEGIEFIGKPADYGEKVRDDYTEHDYHQPSRRREAGLGSERRPRGPEGVLRRRLSRRGGRHASRVEAGQRVQGEARGDAEGRSAETRVRRPMHGATSKRVMTHVLDEEKTMTGDEMVALSRKHTLFEWSAQANVDPIPVARAKGIYFWTPEGKRFIDFNSQLMCVNIGHGDARIVQAIQDQAAVLAYANPFMATEPRARLGAKLAEIAPGDIDVFFFTNGGAEANENAIKLARLATGRHKILARYRSYHGATAGSITLTGDPRRWASEPGIPGVVHVLDPYHGIERGWDTAEQSLAMLEEVIQLEGPHTIAAFILETGDRHQRRPRAAGRLPRRACASCARNTAS